MNTIYALIIITQVLLFISTILTWHVIKEWGDHLETLIKDTKKQGEPS